MHPFKHSWNHTRLLIKADTNQDALFTRNITAGQLRNTNQRCDTRNLKHMLLICAQIDADLAGQTFTPSAPPPDASGIVNPPGRPDSAQSLRSGPQGLRKSRANMRTNTGDRLDSPSRSNTPLGTPQSEQKSANESYFANLGDANASRPADLPPSQGGKYQGFGSTPAPDSPGHPSYGLSSRAAPSLNELQENPMAALSKGWSLFSAAVSGATRAVSENVIQPGMERVLDPTLQANVRGYVSGAGKRAGDLGKTANEWSKTQFGVDVADQVGGVVGTVRERIGGGPESNGYGAVPHHYEGDSGSLYEDEDDFFREHAGETSSPATTSAPAVPPKTPAKKDEWDEWKDF